MYMQFTKPDTTGMVDLGVYCDGEINVFYNESNGGVFIIDIDSGILVGNKIRFYDTACKAKQYADKVLTYGYTPKPECPHCGLLWTEHVVERVSISHDFKDQSCVVGPCGVAVDILDSPRAIKFLKGEWC